MNKMKNLQLIGIIILIISIVCFMLWRFVFALPDWFIRVDGVLMLIAIFATVFSTTRITMDKN